MSSLLSSSTRPSPERPWAIFRSLTIQPEQVEEFFEQAVWWWLVLPTSQWPRPQARALRITLQGIGEPRMADLEDVTDAGLVDECSDLAARPPAPAPGVPLQLSLTITHAPALAELPDAPLDHLIPRDPELWG